MEIDEEHSTDSSSSDSDEANGDSGRRNGENSSSRPQRNLTPSRRAQERSAQFSHALLLKKKSKKAKPRLELKGTLNSAVAILTAAAEQQINGITTEPAINRYIDQVIGVNEVRSTYCLPMSFAGLS